MSILFSVCPHDSAKGLDFWYKFKKDLEGGLGEEVKFEPLSSFEEEIQKLNFTTYDLYYAGFNATLELYKKHYKPIAKIKGQKDEFFLIGKDEDIFKKSHTRFASIKETLIGYESIIFNFEDIDIVYANNFEEVFNLVKEDKADIGFMYSETWEGLDEEQKKA